MSIHYVMESSSMNIHYTVSLKEIFWGLGLFMNSWINLLSLLRGLEGDCFQTGYD